MTILPYRLIDRPKIVQWIHGSYWGGWQSEERIKSALKHSLTFVAVRDSTLVGFIRIVTDYAVFSSITDLYVAPDHRRQGVGRALMEHVLKDTGVRETICVLATRDASKFYARFGFVSLGREVMQRSPT